MARAEEILLPRGRSIFEEVMAKIPRPDTEFPAGSWRALPLPLPAYGVPVSRLGMRLRARQRDRHFDAYQELSPQEDSGCQEVEEVSFEENVGSGRNLSHGLVLTPDAPVGSQNSIVGAE